MNKREVFLKEYETCQSYVNSLGNQYWISMNIIFTINIAALGGIIYAIINSAGQLPRYTPWLILILGLGLIFITSLIKFWQKRVQFLIRINNDRMRELERRLGMERNRIIYGLDMYYRDVPEKNEGFNKLDTSTQVLTTKARINLTEPFWWPLKESFWQKSKQLIRALIWSLFTSVLDMKSDFIDPVFNKSPIPNTEYKPPIGNIVIALIHFGLLVIWITVIALSFSIFDP